MGSLGTPEIILIFVVLIMLAIPIGIAIAVVWYFASRRKQPQPIRPPQLPKGNQERLSEIEELRSRNLISESEYEEKRRQILSDI